MKKCGMLMAFIALASFFAGIPYCLAEIPQELTEKKEVTKLGW